MPRTKKTKAVFVDGVSLSFMRRPMGIGHINNLQFYEVLVREIGKNTNVSVPPLFTFSSRIVGLESFKKNLTTAGFAPEAKDPSKGEDDRFIIDRIMELDPKVVAEIVIVTSDRDFVPCLREKVLAGVKVYWVAVRAEGEEGHPRISPQLEEIFQSGEFEFVDLSKWKERLMLSPWVERPRKSPDSRRPDDSRAVATEGQPLQPVEVSSLTKTIKVVLEVTVLADRTPSILHSVGSLMGNVSRLEGITKTKTTTEVE